MAELDDIASAIRPRQVIRQCRLPHMWQRYGLSLVKMNRSTSCHRRGAGRTYGEPHRAQRIALTTLVPRDGDLLFAADTVPSTYGRKTGSGSSENRRQYASARRRRTHIEDTEDRHGCFSSFVCEGSHE